MSDKSSITMPLLKGANDYSSWTLRMEAHLTSLELFHAIQHPVGRYLTQKDNNKAYTEIISKIRNGPLQIIKNIPRNAKDAWEALEQHYNSSGFSNDHILCTRFLNLSLDDFTSMEKYITVAQKLYNELMGRDIKLPDKIVIAWILNSLNSDYEGFKQNVSQTLRSNEKAYTIQSLFTSLLDEAKGQQYKQQVNNVNTGRNNYNQSNRNKKLWKKNKGEFCSYCKLPNHAEKDCYFLHPNKAPANWKNNSRNRVNKNSKSNKGKQQDEEALLLNRVEELSDSDDEDDDIDNQINMATIAATEDLMDFEEDPLIPSFEVNKPYTPDNILSINNTLGYLKTKEGLHTFIIDSGATIPVVSNISLFQTYKSCNKTVNWGKATSIKVKAIGNLLLKDAETNKLLSIKNAYYIPELGINLISIRKLNDIVTVFDTSQKSIIMHDKNNNEIISRGKEVNGLYQIRYYIINGNNRVYLTEDLETIVSKWHARLGHISLKPLAIILLNNGIINKLVDVKDIDLSKCDICCKTKLYTKVNRKSLNPRQYKVSEKIHSDIAGPIHVTYDKKKYFIVFLDRKSRYLDIELLAHKRDAYEAFKRYELRVNNPDKKIKEFHSDSGSEYTSNRFKAFVQKIGAVQQYTPIGTKEPNGIIERIMRTIFNKIRGLLYNSKAPLILWGEAALAAVYLYNRTPHKSLDFKCPFEVYYNEKPVMDNNNMGIHWIL
jgi:hypothetical protein